MLRAWMLVLLGRGRCRRCGPALRALLLGRSRLLWLGVQLDLAAGDDRGSLLGIPASTTSLYLVASFMLVDTLGALVSPVRRVARNYRRLGLEPVAVDLLSVGCSWFGVPCRCLRSCSPCACCVLVDDLAEQLGSTPSEVLEAVVSHLRKGGCRGLRFGVAETSLGVVVQALSCLCCWLCSGRRASRVFSF